ncbi:hypothetical protein Kpho01_73290 [Kitasatospora phosalacinea]|uniref:Transposase IS116/IS110/IS902 C-terminal domain-containing protein n=1 Tax=Kitasatospora phosalacinea TaxID=2065 RepID=A0A9W6PMS9_9ACTN|nr:hypothetical protein Kpho01_73290 [Kitasatospora phosalacinea]
MSQRCPTAVPAGPFSPFYWDSPRPFPLVTALRLDLAAFATPDRLAGFGGVAPAPRDSGKISGNLHRPQRYNRKL